MTKSGIWAALWRITPAVLGLWGLLVAGATYGYFMRANGWFPDRQLKAAYDLARDTKANLFGNATWWFFQYSNRDPASAIGPKPGMQPGLTLVSGVNRQNPFVRIVDEDRKVLHEWTLDWFALAPKDIGYVTPEHRPRTRPGAQVHGVLLSPDGDLTFNFDQLALTRMDICGAVKWQIPLRTHHSLSLDRNGHIWTSDVAVKEKADPDLPGYKPPYYDYRILEISQEGKVLRSIPVFDLLQKSDHRGLMYLDVLDDYSTRTTGDTLHLNDVEVFPDGMAPGVAQEGDLLVSLRNINSIILMNPDTQTIKRVISGPFLRQHDADFVDGSHMVVFDNNFVQSKNRYSRIVKVSLEDGTQETVFRGKPGLPFESEVMGKHQPLPNGGYLITESTHGRAFEIDADGEIVWEYLNWIEPKTLGRLSGLTRLPPEQMTAERLAQLKARCP